MSLDFADGDFSELIQDLAEDVHAPFFYIILSWFIDIFGLSALTGRVVSILFGAGTVILLFLYVKETREWKTASTAAVLLSLWPMFIEFTREIHPYSASAFFAVLSWFFFIRILRKESRIDFVFYGISCGLLLLSFYMGILVVFSQFLMFVIHWKKTGRKIKLHAMFGWIIGMIVFFPWLPHFISQLKEFRIGVIEQYFPEGVGFSESISLLSDVYFGTFMRSVSTLWPGIGAIVLNIMLFVLILFKKEKRRGGGTAIDPAWWMIWPFWSVFALFIILGMFKPIILSRYLTMAIPFTASFAAFALSRLRKNYLIAAVVILSFIFILCYPIYLKSMPRQNWREPAVFISQRIQPDEVVVVDNVNAMSCMVYYFILMDHPELYDNIFPFELFYENTRGAYPFENRKLYFLYRPGKQHDEMLDILKEKNFLMRHEKFQKGYRVYLFRGKNKKSD